MKMYANMIKHLKNLLRIDLCTRQTKLTDNIITYLIGCFEKKTDMEYFNYRHEIHHNIMALRHCIEDLFIAWEFEKCFSKKQTCYRKYKWNKYIIAMKQHSYKVPFI